MTSWWITGAVLLTTACKDGGDTGTDTAIAPSDDTAAVDACEATTWYADADGDGYGDEGISEEACDPPADFVADATDCDDADADAFPGAAEICDGADNDCDDLVDDDDGDLDATTTTTWYADDDADGYGDAATSTAACVAPSTHVADATDCDDAEAAVNPGAVEVCDELDNDCDTLVDDDDDSVDADTVWYADSDDDGGGDPESTTSACDQPSGHVATGTDCDDADSAVHAEAVEICDALDSDCDTLVDDDDDDLDTATATIWYGDSDTDGYGSAADIAVSCVTPSGYVADGTDCDDTDSAVHPAATEVCDDLDNDCDVFIDDADGSLDATTGSTFYGDSDGDGYGDSATTTDACEAPRGYVDDATDCDDGDAAVSPDASEVCDGVDNDCDALVDDDDGSLDAATATTWYADADADGYGTSSSSSVACNAPSAHVDDATDCDDADADVNPIADEVCDEVDNDCDGLIDDDDDSTVEACWGGLVVDDLRAGDLVVSEVMQNPSAVSDSDGEWFELYVDTSTDVDLEGLWIVDDATSAEGFEVLGTLTASPGSYLVFAVGDDAAVNGGLPTVDYAYAYGDLSLGNGADGLSAETADGTVIDAVTWDGGSAFPDPTGASMTLIEGGDYDDAYNDDGANWCEEGASTYGDGDFGTPGSDGASCL